MLPHRFQRPDRRHAIPTGLARRGLLRARSRRLLRYRPKPQSVRLERLLRSKARVVSRILRQLRTLRSTRSVASAAAGLPATSRTAVPTVPLLQLGQSVAVQLKQGIDVRSCSTPVGLLVAFFALAAASAQSPPPEFQLEEITTPTGFSVERLKPKTIAFTDRPSDELIDPDAGLIRFEDWAQARPVEKQFLTPFPSYSEPTVEATVDGVRKRFKEKLHMYVGEARFTLARAPGSLDLASLVSLPFIERIDPAIKHKLITPAEAVSAKDPRAVHNQHPLRRWCEVRPITICIRSRYQFEGKLPIGIQIANKLRDAPKKIADYLEFESELTLRPPAEVSDMGFAGL